MTKKKRRGGTGKKWGFALPDDQDSVVATQYALGAVKYHLDGIRYHFDRMRSVPVEGEEPPRRIQQDFNKLHHNLRAFFWELCSAFDTLLQEINRRLALGIPVAEVYWHKVSLELSERGEYKKFLKKLEKEFNSPWFVEVREYRNFAHRGTLLVTAFGVDYEFRPDEGVHLVGLMLTPSSHAGRGHGEMITLCESHCTKMKALVEKAFQELDAIRPRA